MQKTLFKKYLRITSLIIVISFFMLGFVMLMFFTTYWRSEKTSLLQKNAQSVAEIAASNATYSSSDNTYLLEEQRMNLHHSVGTEENADTGGEKTFSFTHSDILRFVDAVGDTNSIHRTAHAVVPGLLMVERMLDMWMKKQPETETDVELQAGMKNEMQAGAQAGMKNEMQAGVQVETQNEMQAGMPDSKTFICRFRFEKPVYVDEKLQIQARTEHGKQIYECKREDREIVWNMRIL